MNRIFSPTKEKGKRRNPGKTPAFKLAATITVRWGDKESFLIIVAAGGEGRKKNLHASGKGSKSRAKKELMPAQNDAPGRKKKSKRLSQPH